MYLLSYACVSPHLSSSTSIHSCIMRRQGKQAAAGDRASHSPQPAAPVDPSNVEMNLQLNVDILKVSRGSIVDTRTSSILVNTVVDMIAPETAAQEIQKQSLDSCSKLRSGKVTKFIEIVSLKKQSDIQGSPLWVKEVYFR